MTKTLPKQVRTHVAEILEAMPEAFFVLDSDWRPVYLNPRAERLLPGLSVADAVPIWESLPALEGGRLASTLRGAAERGEAASFEAYLPGLGGWFSVQVYPASDAIAVYMKDITESKRAIEFTPEAAASPFAYRPSTAASRCPSATPDPESLRTTCHTSSTGSGRRAPSGAPAPVSASP